jgi:signal transduction histidine kinase
VKTILVIEDEPAVRDNVLELLEVEGFRALGAENGSAGIRLARDQQPDLIICDIMMPDLDGYAVLEAMRRDAATAMLPFIFLTAKADQDALRQGMELGADDYLTKPFTRAGLLRAIEVRLGRHARLAERFQKKLDDLRRSVTLSLPHELLTPLTGILGYSEILVDAHNDIGPGDVLEMASIINVHARRLYRLIENYLLYTELDVRGVDPDKIAALRASQPCDARAVIVDTAQRKAAQVNRSVDLTCELPDLTACIAAEHLKKIVEELADNAFKFSAVGTPVRVEAWREGRRLELDITDRGRGMTSEQIAEVGAYQQFDRKLYEQQGSGLGLTLAKRLAEVYSGGLVVESVPNTFTTVHVRLMTETD